MGRRLLMFLALGAGTSVPAAGQEPTHVVHGVERNRDAAPPSTLEARLQSVVQEYAGREILRVALFDIVFAKDSAEFVRLNGDALLLIVVVTVDAADLPLSALHAVHDSQRTTLVPFSVHTYQVAPGTYGTVLGQNRMDAFYLVPAMLWLPSIDLIADFPSRPGFVVGRVSGPPGVTYPAAVSGSAPSDSTVSAFLDREFPGFLNP